MPLTLVDLYLSTVPGSTWGGEELVSNQPGLEKNAVIEDEEIEDKKPEHIDGLEVEEVFGVCVVRMNKSGQVTKQSLPEMTDGEVALAEGLFKGANP